MKMIYREQQLLLTAIASRILVFPMLTHWGIVGGMALVGSVLDRAAAFSLVIAPLFIMVVVVVLAILNRDGTVSKRMQRGPGEMRRYSIPIILAGLASSLGGTFLYFHGSDEAGLGAIVLGGAVAVLESWVLAGPVLLGIDGSSKD
jgi:hypothetical protein